MAQVRTKQRPTFEMRGGQHGVIVLSTANRKPSLPATNEPPPPESDASMELAESNDPAAIRKIVRRQAALASAGRRKATIAATLPKRTPKRDSARPSSSTRKPSNTGDSTDEKKVRPPTPPPGALTVATGKFDPFNVHPIEFDAVKDPSVLPSMFRFFMSTVAPLLDLRLPTQNDRRYGRRYSWQTDLPHMALTSPSCFWSLMLASATQIDAKATGKPESSVATLGFRHMVIRSINKRLEAPASSFQNDFGLLVGIAIVGSWEKWYGTEEACQAHCDGLKMLRKHFKEENQPHDLYLQIMSFANTFGSGEKKPEEPSFRREVPQMVELEAEAHEGFTWISSREPLDQNLIRALSSCGKISRMPRGGERTKTVRSLAPAIMGFNLHPRLNQMVSSDHHRNQEADRINLEMHVILQAVGVAMLNYLAERPDEAGTGQIDVVGMGDEVADLGRSVACMPVYDRVLLWALLTVFALNRHAPEKGKEVVCMLIYRLQLGDVSLRDVESHMDAFVFLEEARRDYYQILQAALPDLPDAKPSEGGSWPGGSCRIQ
jgi:hypothetical protein